MKFPTRARRPIRRSAVPAAGMLALVAGCGGNSGEEPAGARAQAAAKAATVQIRAFEFGPPAVTVGAGAKVTFVTATRRRTLRRPISIPVPRSSTRGGSSGARRGP